MDEKRKQPTQPQYGRCQCGEARQARAEYCPCCKQYTNTATFCPRCG